MYKNPFRKEKKATLILEPMEHIHKRKTIHKKLEKYPHPDKSKRILDRLVYVASIGTPLMTIPQLYKIWIDKTTEGLAIITWIAYLISAVIWFSYGYVHKERPIILTNFLWIVIDIAVVIGIILY